MASRSFETWRVALVVLGRWRAANSAFEALFALKPGELAEIINTARPGPGGEYERADLALAFRAHVASDHDDRSFAVALLHNHSHRAGSRSDRLLARTALFIGKRP